MKHVSRSEVMRHENGPACTVEEYGNNGMIDGALIEINGRYPEHGRAMNKISSVVLHILQGEGAITVGDETRTLAKNDVVFIDFRQPYYFEGKVELFMACTPPWSPDQYEAVD